MLLSAHLSKYRVQYDPEKSPTNYNFSAYRPEEKVVSRADPCHLAKHLAGSQERPFQCPPFERPAITPPFKQLILLIFLPRAGAADSVTGGWKPPSPSSRGVTPAPPRPRFCSAGPATGLSTWMSLASVRRLARAHELVCQLLLSSFSLYRLSSTEAPCGCFRAGSSWRLRAVGRAGGGGGGGGGNAAGRWRGRFPAASYRICGTPSREKDE